MTTRSNSCYASTLEETVRLVESNEVGEIEDFSMDELECLIEDLMKANRADLALPYWKSFASRWNIISDTMFKNQYEDSYGNIYVRFDKEK